MGKMMMTSIAIMAIMTIAMAQGVLGRETQYSWGKERDQYGCLERQTYCERLSKCIDATTQSCSGLAGRGRDWYIGTKTLQTDTLRVRQKQGLTVWDTKPTAQPEKGVMAQSGSRLASSQTVSPAGRARADKPVFIATGRRATRGTYFFLSSSFS